MRAKAKVSLFFSFLLATTMLLLQGIVLPGFSLCAYAPWLALVTMRSPWLRALWLSAAAGLCQDLLSDHPFAIHATAYTAATFLLFRFKNHVLVEKPLHLALFSALFSALIALIVLLLLFLFDRRLPFAGIWVFIDLFVMSIADGVVAVAWFSGPLALFAMLHRHWVRFWLKRKNLSPRSR